MRACVVPLPDSRDSETAKSITMVRLKETFRSLNREEFWIWGLIASNISTVELSFYSYIGIPRCEAELMSLFSYLKTQADTDTGNLPCHLCTSHHFDKE